MGELRIGLRDDKCRLASLLCSSVSQTALCIPVSQSSVFMCSMRSSVSQTAFCTPVSHSLLCSSVSQTAFVRNQTAFIRQSVTVSQSSVRHFSQPVFQFFSPPFRPVSDIVSRLSPISQATSSQPVIQFRQSASRLCVCQTDIEMKDTGMSVMLRLGRGQKVVSPVSQTAYSTSVSQTTVSQIQ